MGQTSHPGRLWSVAGATLLLNGAHYGARAVASTVLYDQYGAEETSRALSFLPLAMLLVLPLGGLVADKWLGLRRSMIAGGAMVAAGLALCVVRAWPFLLAGAVLVVLGLGLFRFNAWLYASEGYPKESPGRVAGFTVLYIAINIGSLLSWGATSVSGWFGGSFGFVAATLLAVGGFVVALLLPDEEAAPAQQPADTTHLKTQLLSLLVLGAIYLLAEAALTGTSWMAKPRDYGTYSFSSWFYLLYLVNPITVIVAGVIAVLFWSSGTLMSWTEHFGVAIAVGAGALAFCAVATGLIPGELGPGVGVALGAQALIGLAELAMVPIVIAAASAVLPRPWRATAMGLFALAGIGSYLPTAKVLPPSLSWAGVPLVIVLAGGAVALAFVFRARIEEAVAASPSELQGLPAATIGERVPAADASTDLVIGGVCLLLGVGITVGSVAFAHDAGGRYVVFTGLIIFGIARLIRGVRKLG